MALELLGGDAFTLLYDVIKQAIGKTGTFKYLLKDIKSTLESLNRLQATSIRQIGEYNLELGLPNDEVEDLKEQMEEGAKMVVKLSQFGVWNYCCLSCYTDQLVDLDRSLKRLLDNLKLQEIRDVKEVLDLLRKYRTELDEVKGMLKQLLQEQGAASASNTTLPEQNQGTGQEQASSAGGADLGAVYGMLCDVVIEVKDKSKMFRPLLGDLKSMLDSLKPLVEEMTENNTVLVLHKEELEKFKIKMDKGKELVRKCSKVRPWESYKKYNHTIRLLGLNESIRVQLSRLREQVAMEVEETLATISNVKWVVKQIEGSGVTQNQLEITASCEVPEPPLPTVLQESADYVERPGVIQNQPGIDRDSCEVLEPSLHTILHESVDYVEEAGVVQNLLEIDRDSCKVLEPKLPTANTGSQPWDAPSTHVSNKMNFTVHRSMCIKLVKLVDRIARIFPYIEAARPRFSTGMQALCVLNREIDTANLLLQYCRESSKLYLAVTGDEIVSRCQRSRNLLEQSLCQIQKWVPVILVAEVSQIVNDLKCATFKLDPSEVEAGKVVRELLDQDASVSSSLEDSELKALQHASLMLHITSPKEVLIEKRSIRKLLENVGDCNPTKKNILTYCFYLLKKYGNAIMANPKESASVRQQGSHASENSGNDFEYNQSAEVEAHSVYGVYEAQYNMLVSAVPPEEFLCGISSRLMYDPVVIASGETYERMWIQKWFDEGHDTCPKTNIKLAHLSLNPNIGMKDLISRWCTKYGVFLPNPNMLPESLRAWEYSSTSIFSSGRSMDNLQTDLSTMSFGSLDTFFNSVASGTHTEDCSSFMQSEDSSLSNIRHRAGKCETEFLSNIGELKWDEQCKLVEDINNKLKCNADVPYLMSSKNTVEPLIMFLTDAHDLDDVKAQRDGLKLLSTFVSQNRTAIQLLHEGAYTLLASYLNSKVTGEVLAIMEIVSGHENSRSKISASGAVTSILKLLNSQIRSIQVQAIKVLCNLSLDREICSEMVSLECIPKLAPFFEDCALRGNCMSILRNLCNTEGARISITDINGCIDSVVEVLDTGSQEDQEKAVDILLSLCSQRNDYSQLVMHEGVISALVTLSVNGTERARINSMEVLRLLRDHVNYNESPESPRPEPVAPIDIGNNSNEKKAPKPSGFFGKKIRTFSKPSSLSPKKKN